MNHTQHHQTQFKALIATVAFACTPLWAQMATAMPASSSTEHQQSKESSSVNPLTGQFRSTEALARELAKAKLEAELSETQVKLAKSQGDLALATLRQEAEQKRLREEIANMNKPQNTQQTRQVINLPPLVVGTANPGSPTASKASTPPPSLQAQGQHPLSTSSFNVLAPQPRPQGTISIGQERVDVQTQLSASNQVARVEFVDAQNNTRPHASSALTRPTTAIQTQALPAATMPLVIPPLDLE